MTVERPGDWSAYGVSVVRKRLPARKTLLILCVVIQQSNTVYMKILFSHVTLALAASDLPPPRSTLPHPGKFAVDVSRILMMRLCNQLSPVYSCNFISVTHLVGHCT